MHLIVSASKQQVTVYDHDATVSAYPVSTSKFGLGESAGSYQTPRGHHIITEKIGTDATPGTIFKGRIPTGQIWTPDMVTEDDLILTRILWLAGEEAHNANSHDRYIYFHGTNQEALIGQPASIGCIRLTNTDIISLFEQVEVGSTVEII